MPLASHRVSCDKHPAIGLAGDHPSLMAQDVT
jgi:hypothetical protein